ncbi:cell division protein SepF [Halalkalibacillus halophilus]|uniref:cell division protein SepF n=1 Tax=Halalkalibacillus halophilus TaxID=392827 RepID=UPI0003FFDBBD|nr:cell division protein SepF [Halalkalibacillus halophilus]
MSFKDRFKSFFEMDEPKTEDQEGIEVTTNDMVSAKYKEKDNVVSLTSIQNDTKMVLCEPKEYEEAQDIADHIKKKKSVVINLQQLDHYTSKRIIDFLSGTVYALNGNIQKLGQQTFLATPEHVNISGSISELFDETEQQFNKGR